MTPTRSNHACRLSNDHNEPIIHAPRPLYPQALSSPFHPLLLHAHISSGVYVNTSYAYTFTEGDDSPTLQSHVSRTVMPPNHRLPVDGNDYDVLSPTLRGKHLNAETVGIEHQMRSIMMDRICSYLMDVFCDLDKCEKFLKYRDEAAQCLVNFLQSLLDRSSLNQPFRAVVLTALLRLSRESKLYPQCFSLTNVTREGDHPVTYGNFGDIYKGRFRGRDVCLKVVRLYTTSDHARTCLYNDVSREALLWGQLSHTNILPFYGIYRLGDTFDKIGLVSPWMHNGNINEFLERNPDAERRLLISDIAAGMLYLHNNKVVHGDLKGVNILVTDSKRACLVDFALSSVTTTHVLKRLPQSSVEPEGSKTTDRFQAPELFDLDCELPRSEASDVYAFAMVCYEIFVGSPPFPEVSRDFNVMLKVAEGERPGWPCGRVYRNRGLSCPMWKLMEECWSQHPEDRLTASQIMLRLPRVGVDVRPEGGWDEFLPSRACATTGWHDALVAEALRYLKAL